VSRCVRRVLFTVLVFVLGLAVGFTAGLATGLLSRSVDAGWLEAVGTWVGAGITLIAVIVAALAFFSEEYTRRREDRRQVQADERAERAERDRLQRAADVVWYEVDAVFERSAYEALEGTGLPGAPRPAKRIVQAISVMVANNSSSEITKLACRLTLNSTNRPMEPIDLRDSLGPGKSHIEVCELSAPFEAHEGEDRRVNLQDNVELTFILGGVQWAKRHNKPARSLSAW
jgi:hypothetical protein